MLNVRNLASLNVSGSFLARKATVKLPRSKKPSGNTLREHKAKCNLLEDTGGCIRITNEEQETEEAQLEGDEQKKAESLVVGLGDGSVSVLHRDPQNYSCENKETQLYKPWLSPKHPQNLGMSGSSPRYHWKNYQYVLTFLFAIDEINKSPYLLLNLSLGYSLYNAFTSDKRTLQNALILLSGGNQSLPNYNCQTQKQSVAIIAGNMPTFSAQVGTLLELYKSPQDTPALPTATRRALRSPTTVHPHGSGIILDMQGPLRAAAAPWHCWLRVA
ncbi:Vomeronasal type-2 receptor 26 [Tupaia chinensis]|uniref:Vomeronasal type-2 receptor 26 n=1 Tax=Tupaia chinensis TaxID=246437 RepID=L9JEG6_TUPCH|nr:Vomeronasal type-2 receptor 26 [Tupaia chinensis]